MKFPCIVLLCLVLCFAVTVKTTESQMPVLDTFKLLVINSVIGTACHHVRYIYLRRHLLLFTVHKLVNLLSVDKNA